MVFCQQFIQQKAAAASRREPASAADLWLTLPRCMYTRLLPAGHHDSSVICASRPLQATGARYAQTRSAI